MIAIITNATCPCGCCGTIVEIVLKKYYQGTFRIEKGRAIFEGDLPREVLDQVNAELPHGHQLLTGMEVHFIELIQDALKEMLVRIENRGLQKMSAREEIKIIQHLVHKKTDYSYDGMEKLYKRNMSMSILHAYIVLKVERVQQLIIEKMHVLDIMERLNYCNKPYMEKQYKEITGKKLKNFILEQKFQKNH